jgi:hypothetical protein
MRGTLGCGGGGMQRGGVGEGVHTPFTALLEGLQ